MGRPCASSPLDSSPSELSEPEPDPDSSSLPSLSLPLPPLLPLSLPLPLSPLESLPEALPPNRCRRAASKQGEHDKDRSAEMLHVRILRSGLP